MKIISAFLVLLSLAFCYADSEQQLRDEYNQMMSGSALSPEQKESLEAGMDRLIGINNDIAIDSGDRGHRVLPGIALTEITEFTPPPPSICYEKTCCIDALTPIRKCRSFRISYTCCVYYNKRFQTSCGTWGWGRCTIYRPTTRQGTCYRSQCSYYYEQPTCQSGRHICCKGYVEYKGCCIDADQYDSVLSNYRSRG